MRRFWPWRRAEEIEETAALSYLGLGDIDLSGSGSGLVAFMSERAGGPKVQPAMTADRRPYPLAAGSALSRPLATSGGFSEDDPDASFFRSFFADPAIHLTPGDWTITAVASFYDGTSCGRSHRLATSVTIHVEA